MKFAMGSQTLGQLTKQTQTSGEDLASLVRQLGDAAEPLEGRFNGTARAAFDQFKVNTDQIAVELSGALQAVLAGVAGMDRSFVESESEMADQTRSSQGSVSFDAARFSTGA
ncbi:hypothetical protein [Demequina sp. NBRC 110055]|uniref:hypothetical protein n=1 Tax=Demequina sp. NBRC 110055 TaxID=1570344 RepID=UPI0009FD4ADF|nr:hypothetical protein [Demequina sp. NBRC 110055]